MTVETSTPIVAIIPTYNEVSHVVQVVRRSLAHLPTLVVDDGSTDGSGAAAAAEGAIVVTHQRNQGKGAALATGIRWGLAQGCEAVVTLDADGQHDPDEIPIFLAAYQADLADLIIGRRSFGEMPRRNRFGNTVGSRMLGWALRRPIQDNQCGYRLLNRRAMEALRFTTSGFEFEVEMIVQAALAGLRIDWVPIRTIYAGESSHFRVIEDSLEFVKLICSVRRRAGRAIRAAKG